VGAMSSPGGTASSLLSPAARGTDRDGRLNEIVNARTAAPLAIALSLLVGLADFATEAQVRFTLLYLLPVGIAAWFRGRRFAMAVALLCVVFWGATLLRHPEYARPLVIAWNVVGQAGVFLTFGYVLRRLRTKIEHEVLEREHAVEQLRHADRLNAIGKMAAGVAHELGTPLNVVGGRAQLIAMERVTGPDVRKSAETIQRQVERMSQILRNMLDFARRGGGASGPVELGRIVRDTVSLLQPLAVKSRVTLSVEEGEPVVARIPAAELQQVLTNLVMNAVHAMPSGGGVHLSLGVQEVNEPPPYAMRAPSYAFIRVRDEGTGIPESVLPHIFDPFFTTKEVGVGTGLGLSVSFGIVRDHGGWIAVCSEVGRGAELTIFLPQSSADGA
jgi:signal transduction histidine kinase